MRAWKCVVLVALFAGTLSLPFWLAPRPVRHEKLEAVGDSNKPDVGQLVRGVRQAEEWVHEVDRLSVTLKGVWVRTPYGIAKIRKELETQFPGAPIDTTRFADLWPELTETLTVAFDRKRIATAQHQNGYHSSHQVWDGVRTVAHLRYFNHGDEYYAIDNTRDRFIGDPLAELSWLRTRPHSFWWDGPRAAAVPSVEPDEFRWRGVENFNGVACHMLDAPDGDERWYVGVSDGRLYGQTEGKGLESEFSPAIVRYLGDWREIGQGRWFPMVQGYRLMDYADGVAKEVLHRSLTATEVRPDQPIPETLFSIVFRDGVQIHDWEHDPPLHYCYKVGRTAEEMAAIVEAARHQHSAVRSARDARDRLVGAAAPPFPRAAEWFNGGPLGWRDMRGKVVVLDFFADWCMPCRTDLPAMRAVHTGRQQNGIAVLGIHPPGSSRESILGLINRFELGYPVCIDTVTDDNAFWGQLYAAYAVDRLPYAVVVGTDGRVVAHGAPAEMLVVARRLATAKE